MGVCIASAGLILSKYSMGMPAITTSPDAILIPLFASTGCGMLGGALIGFFGGKAIYSANTLLKTKKVLKLKQSKQIENEQTK